MPGRIVLALLLVASHAFPQDVSGAWRGEWHSGISKGLSGPIQANLKQSDGRVDGEIEFVSTIGAFILHVSEKFKRDEEIKIEGTARSKQGDAKVKVTVALKLAADEITGTYEFPVFSDSGTFTLRRGVKKREAEFVPGTHEGATLEIVEGIPRLRVKGGPAEIGRQVGHLLKPQIRFMVERYMAPFLADRREEALIAARRMESHIPAKYVEEMKAVAEAAEVSYEDMLLANTAVEIYQLTMCSAVAVRGSLTKEGVLLFGRNLDFPSLGILEQYSVVVEVEPKEGRRFVSVTWPGLVGVLSGMNEKGLAIANLVAFGVEHSTDGTPYMFLLRQAMEKAETVKEATRLLQDARRTTANSILVADASRDAAVLEVSHGKAVVREIENDRVFATNNFVRPGEKAARCPRFRKLVRMADESKTPIDVSGVTAMLDAVHLGGTTVQSMVFVPEKREIHLATGEAPASGAKFVRMAFLWK